MPKPDQDYAALFDSDDGDATLWPAGRVRLVLTDQAILGEAATQIHPFAGALDGIVLHENAAGSIIAIDLPTAPIDVEPLG